MDHPKIKTLAFYSNKQFNQAAALMEYSKPKVILLDGMKAAFGQKLCKPGFTDAPPQPCKGGSAAGLCKSGIFGK